MPKYCSDCGAKIAEGARFCESCGARVPEEEPVRHYCGSCGAEVLEGDMFCPYCGAKRNVKAKRTPRLPRKQVYIPPEVEQVRTEEGAAVPVRGKSRRGLCVFLALLMVAELCVAGFKYPGFLRKGRKGGNGAEGYAGDLLDYLGLTEADLADYLQSPIEATPENSPGNPDFLELSFTQAEYDAAQTLTAAVSRDNPTADFPEFGIHADLKWWNLENETDTLVVKRMPTKTVDGAAYYTYDFSLESGQDKFPTNVEITVPVQSPGGEPANVLTVDPETGRWKEVYYSLSDDGKSYTLCMDHFTLGSESSEEVMTFEDGTKVVYTLQYEDGKSIFDYISREGAAKYGNTSHYLYNIGIIRTPDFESFLNHDAKQAVKVLNSLVDKGGGVPAEAGLSESSNCFGDAIDKTSFVSTVLSLVPMSKDMEGANSGCGLALGILGTGILGLRVGEQYSRGVSWDKIGSSNKWGIASTIVTVLGLPFFGLPTAAVAVAGGAIFVCSKIDASRTQAEREKKILQNPRTIEEGAYDYFLYEYTREVPESVVINDPAYTGVKGNDKAMYDIAYTVANVDAQGNMWASFMKYLFDRYKDDPETLVRAVEGVYSRFVSRYWSLDESAKPFREICWRKALENIMNEGYAYSTVEVFGFTVKDEAEKLGISEEEYRRRAKIYYEINTNGKSIDDIVADWKAGKYPAESVDAQAYEDRALGIVYENTNEILYGLYTTYRENAIVELKEKIRKEILPWMNTRMTFYWRDPEVKSGTMHQNSLYYQFLYDEESPEYKFDFDCDRNKPLYLPGNRTNVDFGLFMKPNAENNVLLETTVYNYLMWRCPKDVKVYKASEGDRGAGTIHAAADFSKVVMRADPNSCVNGNGYVNLASWARNIKDIKVPVQFEQKEEAAAYSLVDIDDHGNSSSVLELASIAMKEGLEGTGLKMAKDGSFTVSTGGSVSTKTNRDYTLSLIPDGDDDPDPAEWVESDGSCTVEFTLSGSYDAKSEKGTATIEGSGQRSDSYTYGHKSGKKTYDSSSGTATFSGSTTLVWKEKWKGKDAIRISFFVHDENGTKVNDLMTYTRLSGDDETMEYGWWIEFVFAKD